MSPPETSTAAAPQGGGGVLAPERIFAGRFDYPGLWPAQRCTCDLRAYRWPGIPRVLVVATERADNPGASVTNAIEQLATAAWWRFQPQVDQPPWLVERWAATSYEPGRELRPHHVECSWVEFTRIGRPSSPRRPLLAGARWTFVTRAWVEHLTGEALP